MCSLRFKTLLTAGLCLALLAPISLAQDAEKPQRDKAEKREQRQEKRQEIRKKAGKMLMKDITLTDEQKTKIKAIREKAKAEVEAWKEANKDKMEALREQAAKARKDKDREALQATMQEVKKLMETRPRPIEHADEVRAVLTADQQAQFDKNLKVVQERREKMIEKRQKKMGERKKKVQERKAKAETGSDA